MSSLLVCAQPATSPAFIPREAPAVLLKRLAEIPRLTRVTQASHLEVRPAPEQVSTGIAEIDALTGGLPRGCLTEIYGQASSGRSSLLVSALAAATKRQEACALVDASDAFDPQCASAAGMNFRNLLWVRCQPKPPKSKKFSKRKEASAAQPKLQRYISDREENSEFSRLEQVMKTTDLLLQSGGFGLVAIDLGDISLQAARRIPLTSWFRFRRAVENTPTVLLVVGQGPCARTCASLLLQLQADGNGLQGKTAGIIHDDSLPTHTRVLSGLSIHAEIARSRMDRKPAQSVSTKFCSRALWTG